MKPKLKAALDSIDMVYEDVVEIAKEVVDTASKEINEIISSAGNVKELTDQHIRNLIVLLSMKSFSFAEHKDYVTSKSRIAETLRKETYAKVYNSVEGTGGVRENTALMETNAEIVAEIVMDLVSSLLKTKLDEVHRLVDSLKSSLMSRMQEAKLTMLNKAAYE